jgi:hypothetical protein
VRWKPSLHVTYISEVFIPCSSGLEVSPSQNLARQTRRTRSAMSTSCIYQGKFALDTRPAATFIPWEPKAQVQPNNKVGSEPVPNPGTKPEPKPSLQQIDGPQAAATTSSTLGGSKAGADGSLTTVSDPGKIGHPELGSLVRRVDHEGAGTPERQDPALDLAVPWQLEDAGTQVIPESTALES